MLETVGLFTLPETTRDTIVLPITVNDSVRQSPWTLCPLVRERSISASQSAVEIRVCREWGMACSIASLPGSLCTTSPHMAAATTGLACMPVAEIEIVVTCANAEEAARIGRSLVEGQLAACAMQWPVRTCYRWQGAIHEATEELLTVKSTEALFGDACRLITAQHSYEQPAITMVRLAATGPGYRRWLRDCLIRFPHPSP